MIIGGKRPKNYTGKLVAAKRPDTKTVGPPLLLGLVIGPGLADARGNAANWRVKTKDGISTMTAEEVEAADRLYKSLPASVKPGYPNRLHRLLTQFGGRTAADGKPNPLGLLKEMDTPVPDDVTRPRMYFAWANGIPDTATKILRRKETPGNYQVPPDVFVLVVSKRVFDVLHEEAVLSGLFERIGPAETVVKEALLPGEPPC